MLKIYCVLTLNWYMVNLNSNVPSIDDLVLPLIIIPNEKINRTLRMIEVKQNELWVSCRGPITLLWRTRKEGIT